MAKTIKTKKGKSYYIADDGSVYGESTYGASNETTATYRGSVVKTPTAVRNMFKGKGTIRYKNLDDFTKATKTSFSKPSSPKKQTTTTSLKSVVTTPKRKDLATNKAAKTTEKTSTTSTRQNKTTVRPASPKKTSTTPSSRISSNVDTGNYTINKGDSLWRIAKNNGLTLSELMQQNPQIKNINQIIRPGDKINVNSKNNTSQTTPSVNYDDIILDDSRLGSNSINTTPTREQLEIPETLEPITYSYKKKKK